MGVFVDGDSDEDYGLMGRAVAQMLSDRREAKTPDAIVAPRKIDISFIAALKGKAAPAPSVAAISADTNAGDTDSALPDLPPIVAPRPVDDDDLYPVSATIPVSEVHQELSRLRAELGAMEDALAMANETIAQQHSYLAEANGRIGSLLIERTQGVEGIIASLREFQLKGTANGPVGVNLSGIFANSTALLARGKISEQLEEFEARMKAALQAFQLASSHAFNFTIDAYDRPDFWVKNSNDNYELDKDKSAKMLIVSLTRPNDLVAQDSDKFVLFAVANRYFYASFADIKTKADKVDMFLNSKGTLSPAMFYMHGQFLNYNYANSNSWGHRLDKTTSTLDALIDEFCAQNLVGKLTSAEFSKAMKGFKAMGLTP